MENIFLQTENQFEIKIVFASKCHFQMSQFLEQYDDTMSYFEKNENSYEASIWLGSKNEADNLLEKILIYSEKNNIDIIESSIIKIIDKDWVSFVQESFKPIKVGNFYIHNSSDNELHNQKINIRIDPGRAFGTGEHETTKLCLQALSEINTKNSKILDLGCGSGILAIAASKSSASEIFASDIDQISVQVAHQNALDNNEQKIQFYVCDGFNNQNIQKQKFDLILANILANPLIILATEFTDRVTKNGKIILSGFLENQLDDVVKQYIKAGFQLNKIYSENKWRAVLMDRNH